MGVIGKIGFIGAGNMAEALIKGILGAGLAEPDNVFVTNKEKRERLFYLQDTWGVRISEDREKVISDAQVVILAAKPNDMPHVMTEVKELITENQLVISVAAGITLSWLESHLKPGVPVIRTMSNTSCQVKEAATAMSLGTFATESNRFLADAIFGSIGLVVVVPEESIDAVTGLSGSGPAYVYLMLESLVEAGMNVGLPREIAKDLAVQTVFGAAKMVKDTGCDPSELRAKVASPGGTTMAALSVLEKAGFSNTLVSAVQQATLRSKELGRLNV